MLTGILDVRRVVVQMLAMGTPMGRVPERAGEGDSSLFVLRE
jgi:hypothetical protein